MPDEPEVTDLQTDSLSRFYQVRGEVITDTKNENIFDYVDSQVNVPFWRSGSSFDKPWELCIYPKKPKTRGHCFKTPVNWRWVPWDNGR